MVVRIEQACPSEPGGQGRGHARRSPEGRGRSEGVVWYSAGEETGGWGPRGEAPFFYRNGIWRVDLGAHPKLWALIGALLELCFFV